MQGYMTSWTIALYVLACFLCLEVRFIGAIPTAGQDVTDVYNFDLQADLTYNASLGAPWIAPAHRFVTLHPTNDFMHFLVPLSVGMPAQSVLVMLDTASTGLTLFNQTEYCRLATVSEEVTSNDDDGCYEYKKSSSFGLGPESLSDVFSLLIDGEVVWDSEVLNVLEDVSMESRHVVSAMTQTKSLEQTDFQLSSNLVLLKGQPYPLHNFEYLSGVLGAAYKQTNVAAPFLNLLEDYADITHAPSFSLDLNSDPISEIWNTESRLYLGGINETYRESLVWGQSVESNTNATGTNGYHLMEIEQITVCDYDLSEQESTAAGYNITYRAIVDTGASCLTLPAELFERVVSRLPVKCLVNEVPGTEDGRVNKACFLVSLSRNMPTFSFKIVGSEEPLHLRLDDLLQAYSTDNLNVAGASSRFCLNKGLPLADYANAPYEISFGALALKSFFVAFNMETRQVGFSNKKSLVATDAQCVEQMSCVGMQRVYEPLNMCVDPNCEEYYFFALNAESKTCYLHKSFHVAAVIILVLFIGMEMGLNEIRLHLVGKIIAANPDQQ